MFPTVISRTPTSITTGATSHAINVGSPSAGDLLLILLRINTGPGTWTFTGFTAITNADANGDDASNDVLYAYWKVATGAEGADEPASSTNVVKLAAICYRISNAEDPTVQPPETPAPAVFTTVANTADPPTCTPTGGAKDYLWIAWGSGDQEVGAFTAAPSNYTNLTTANTGTAGAVATNIIMGSAERQLNASSENPGTFTHAAMATGGSAYTIAVHPAPVAAFVPRSPGVNFQDPGVFCKKVGRIFVPRLWRPEPQLVVV